MMRGTGPIGYPGGRSGDMRPPAYLLKRGVNSLPCVGDGRQSGTSGSPSILNAAPEAAAGGGLALVQTGDIVRIDLNACTANILISDEELERRAAPTNAHRATAQTPWQDIFQKRSANLTMACCWKDQTNTKISRHAMCRATTTKGQKRQ